jgi:DNA primase
MRRGSSVAEKTPRRRKPALVRQSLRLEASLAIHSAQPDRYLQQITQPYAHGLAQTLDREYRSLVVSDMAKELRKGKVFIDEASDFKTTVAPYSPRAKQQQPYVSLPVRWNCRMP